MNLACHQVWWCHIIINMRGYTFICCSQDAVYAGGFSCTFPWAFALLQLLIQFLHDLPGLSSAKTFKGNHWLPSTALMPPCGYLQLIAGEVVESLSRFFISFFDWSRSLPQPKQNSISYLASQGEKKIAYSTSAHGDVTPRHYHHPTSAFRLNKFSMLVFPDPQEFHY